MPQIVIFEPLGDGTKDRGEKRYLLHMDKKALQKKNSFSGKVAETFPLDEIAKVDCYRSDSIQQNNQASGAATGFILGGVGGAMVGSALNSGQKAAWIAEIGLKDGQTKYYILKRDQDRNAFVKWATKMGYMDL